ncbi:MAG TPA: hypothetical protein DD422_11560, partial [Akkermansia sp.]|nr:hypothetical protein [Akkermansia sp.]
RGGEGRRNSIKNAGGDAPARYPAIVLTEGRSVFFAGGALCQTAFFRLLNPRRAFVLLEKRPYQGTPGKNRTAVF